MGCCQRKSNALYRTKKITSKWEQPTSYINASNIHRYSLFREPPRSEELYQGLEHYFCHHHRLHLSSSKVLRSFVFCLIIIALFYPVLNLTFSVYECVKLACFEDLVKLLEHGWLWNGMKKTHNCSVFAANVVPSSQIKNLCALHFVTLLLVFACIFGVWVCKTCMFCGFG